MSVEPQLERSVLERKERDELQTIARALGAQPPARARKADLVDLILERAGVPVGDAASATETPAPTRRRGRGRSSQDTAASEAAPDAGSEEDADADAAPAAAGGAPDVAEDEPAPRSDAPAPSGPPARSGPEQVRREANGHRPMGQQPQGEGGDRRGRQGGGGPATAERDEDEDEARDREGQGEAQDREQDGQVDGDQGNRRRRRRGRDRDRDRDRQDDQSQGEPVECAGVLDLRDEGYGFLRTQGYLPSKDDVYVSVKQVRQFGLRKGDLVAGASRPANRTEKNPALMRIDEVNGRDPDQARARGRFEDLTPLFPDERLRMETGDPNDMTARIIDLISPIGKGQRGLIVSPPKAGKTTVMKTIATSIERNNPEVALVVLLVDERPEEVTDMRRTVRGEVVASTFDRPADEHTQVAELVIERAKRRVEYGEDVVIILDGITRLARAYNLTAPATGRIMSGGVDSGALYPPKRFFGAARNIEEGGSLTILATALVDTGSKMDEVIFEEFKGTGNMELRLDRRLAERRIYPALDVDGSSTRHEELLFDRTQLQQVWRVRRALHALSVEGASPSAALERLMDGMRTFTTNDEFLAEAAKAGSPA